MAFNINEIHATLNKTKGVLLPSHFVASITPPTTVQGTADNRIFMELCESASLPGVRFQTVDIKPWGYGVPEQRPVQATQQPVMLTFICDGQAKIIKMFHKWVQQIYNINPYMKADHVTNKQKMYDFSYPSTHGEYSGYEGTMQIHHYNSVKDEVIKYEFTGVWPLAISDVQVSWGSKDEYVKFQVEMDYIHWYTSGFSNGYSTATSGKTAGDKTPKTGTTAYTFDAGTTVTTTSLA